MTSNASAIVVGALMAYCGVAHSEAHSEAPAKTPIKPPAASSTTVYVWKLPPGFPPPRVPADNPMSDAKVRLGCRLFFDSRLSSNGTYSCASCHRPELAYSDARAQAIGATGELVRRNSMSLTNVAYNARYTWASRAIDSLETQMRIPLFGKHPLEMGRDEHDVNFTTMLATDADYARAFRESFPTESSPVATINIVKAIAAFERTLISGRSAFDKFVFDDQRDALSPSARRGMELFYSARSSCSLCHSGLNFSGPIIHERTANKDALFANTGLYNADGTGNYPESDNGLIEETHDARDAGRFRVPTLRNIARTAPYMHDGSVATLSDAIDHYSVGGLQRPAKGTGDNKHIDKNIKTLALTADEKHDLIDFLTSLTDDEFISGPPASCQH